MEGEMNKIKEFRKIKKISQSDIAGAMKIKQNTFSQWENGKRIPNVLQGLKLAEILGTTVEDLYK
jgi:transcriptional regulator with XRE-family HTH domain